MMRFRFGRYGGWLAGVMAAAALVLLPALAAAQVNTATIEVMTFDQQGLPMPGVTVQARTLPFVPAEGMGSGEVCGDAQVVQGPPRSARLGRNPVPRV